MQHLIIERRREGKKSERHHLPVCDRTAQIIQSLTPHERTTLLHELGVLCGADAVLGWDGSSTPAEREQQSAAVPPGNRTYHELAELRNRFKAEVIEHIEKSLGRLPNEMAVKFVSDLHSWISDKVAKVSGLPF